MRMVTSRVPVRTLALAGLVVLAGGAVSALLVPVVVGASRVPLRDEPVEHDSGAATANAPLHDEPVEHDSLEAGTSLPALMIRRDPSRRRRFIVSADVAVDEEFTRRVGDGWRDALRQTLDDANRLLAEVGMRIEVDSLQQWNVGSTDGSLRELLADAAAQAHRTPGRMLLAVTGTATTRFDGRAEGKKGRLIVHFYAESASRNASLIAHEVAHLIGARHHENESECDSDGCIMDKKGYAHANSWCEHHQRALRDVLSAAAPLDT